MYVGKERQVEFYDYIYSLHPERIIFNPGTANEPFMKKLKEKNIEVIEECMLVMLDEKRF